MTEMQSVQIEREKINRLDKFAITNGTNTKKPFPSVAIAGAQLSWLSFV